MALRVIEIVVPAENAETVQQSLEEHRPEDNYVFWAGDLTKPDGAVFRIVLEVQESENLMDRLESMVGWREEYRMVVYPAQATVPRLSEPEEEKPENGKEAAEKTRQVSREELYETVEDTCRFTASFAILLVLSSIVAVIGLLNDNAAVVIGAMVLAPLLGPNVGLSLGTTLGDLDLARRSVLSLVSGVLICFAIALAAGYALPLPDGGHELMLRTSAGYGDVVLAMVSGVAGILSFTFAVSTSLVGVMVALSLLPPLVASGLFLGNMQLQNAGGAALLFGINVICLNLAGVVTFVAQGIRPRKWYEKKRATHATRRMVALWAVLLLVLLLLIYFEKKRLGL